MYTPGASSSDKASNLGGNYQMDTKVYAYKGGAVRTNTSVTERRQDTTKK